MKNQFQMRQKVHVSISSNTCWWDFILWRHNILCSWVCSCKSGFYHQLCMTSDHCVSKWCLVTIVDICFPILSWDRYIQGPPLPLVENQIRYLFSERERSSLRYQIEYSLKWLLLFPLGKFTDYLSVKKRKRERMRDP